MSSSSLSVLQQLDIPLAFLQAALGTFLTALVSPFRSSKTRLKRYLLLDITRRALWRLSTAQMQFISGTTEKNYIDWTRQHHLPTQIVELPSSQTKACWFGEPTAQNVVLYYHGGGWAMPGAAGHFEFVSTLVTQAQRAGKSLSVLFLCYELAPGGRYPRQLTQAVEALRYCAMTLEKSPNDIMLLGDSSGANLILGVLSHLMHPHPEIPPLEIAAPLKGAMISSPVTLLNTENVRFHTQERDDPASRVTIDTWFSNILNSRIPDAWNQQLTNDPVWWSTLDKTVKEVLITVASIEMMADDTLACAEKIKSVYNGLTIFASDADFHAQCTIGPSLGLELGEAAGLMVSWAIERS